jgi:hypothetical protein
MSVDTCISFLKTLSRFQLNLVFVVEWSINKTKKSKKTKILRCHAGNGMCRLTKVTKNLISQLKQVSSEYKTRGLLFSSGCLVQEGFLM